MVDSLFEKSPSMKTTFHEDPNIKSVNQIGNPCPVPERLIEISLWLEWTNLLCRHRLNRICLPVSQPPFFLESGYYNKTWRDSSTENSLYDDLSALQIWSYSLGKTPVLSSRKTEIESLSYGGYGIENIHQPICDILNSYVCVVVRTRKRKHFSMVRLRRSRSKWSSITSSVLS
jgi:hypothetical protein